MADEQVVTIVIRTDAGGNKIAVVKCGDAEAPVGFQAPSVQAAIEQLAGGLVIP